MLHEHNCITLFYTMYFMLTQLYYITKLCYTNFVTSHSICDLLHAYLLVYIYTDVYIYIWTCMNMHGYICAHTCIYVYIGVGMYESRHTYRYEHIMDV